MSREHYPNNWKTIRQQVLKRDAYECQMQLPGCLQDATTVDHIVPIAQWQGQPDEAHHPQNLRAACTACNYSKGGREGKATQIVRQKARSGFVEANEPVGVFLEDAFLQIGRAHV